jgi:hypothetical protein
MYRFFLDMMCLIYYKLVGKAGGICVFWLAGLFVFFGGLDEKLLSEAQSFKEGFRLQSQVCTF